MGVPNETCVALDADHVHMTRSDDPTNEVYQLIIGLMREIRNTAPKRHAEAGKACNFQRRDDLIVKFLGLVKDDEQITVHPKGM